jgi:hypothetical protein
MSVSNYYNNGYPPQGNPQYQSYPPANYANPIPPSNQYPNYPQTSQYPAYPSSNQYPQVNISYERNSNANKGVPAQANSNNLRQTFDQWDLNRNGHIDERELTEALRQMGELSDPETVREMIKSYDTDGSGTIDFYGNQS